MSTLDAFSETDVLKLISDLNFIAKFGKDSLITISTRNIVSKDAKFAELKRKWYHWEDRTDIYKFLLETIEKTFKFIKIYNDSTHKEEYNHKLYANYYINIKDKIKLARTGIESLKIRYATDTGFTSNLDSLITSINSHMQINDELLLEKVIQNEKSEKTKK